MTKKKKPPPPKEWHCPRCGQLNWPDERWCAYCKLDHEEPAG